jgi:hypothetical protein
MIDLPAGVKLMVFSREKMLELWNNLKPFDSIFTDEDMKNPDVFLNNLLAQDSVTLEMDGGVVIIKRIVPGHKAEFHATFWDKKLSPRKDLLKACLVWCFATFSLERVETWVAGYAKAVRRFLEDRLGFRHEGTLRSYARNRGRLVDIHVYGMLRGELEI